MIEEQMYRREWGMREPKIRHVMMELDKHNEVKCGAKNLVRIPKIEGKTSIRQSGPHQAEVFYIFESKWDKEKKQMRNRKTMIGQVMEDFPGAMLPNDNYYRLFDRETGKPWEIAEDEEPLEIEDETCLDESAQDEPSPGSVEEEDENEMTERQEMIRDVLENEGVIRRDSERVREVIRGKNETRGPSPRFVFETEETVRSESGQNETQGTLSATEIVGTPHCGDSSFSVVAQGCRPFSAENCPQDSFPGASNPSSDETSATGGRQSFAPRFVRRRILLDMLASMRDVIKDQARKRPEDVVPAYQVEKINPVLAEIREIELELGYGEMLEVIPEPKTRIDAKTGETYLEGMTYGDAEILMECYNSVIWFTRGEIT